MNKVSTKKKTVLIVLAVVLVCATAFTIQQNAFAKREAEIKSRYTAWQAPNNEVEQDIKDYIDNIDWAYYTNQAVEAIKHPVVTAADILNYFGL